VRILCIGEIIWDVIGPSEYLGGAPLNVAAHARKLGHEVYLVSAVGDDERGQRAMGEVLAHDISTDFVQVVRGKPTGTCDVELGPDGKPIFRIVRPAAYDFLKLDAAKLDRIGEIEPDWIYYGTLYHTTKRAMASTLELLRHLPSAKVLYDVNLREGNWSLATVEQLAARASVIKLSDSEAEFLDASLDMDGEPGGVEHFCRRWCDQYRCKTICVTLGERGCGVFMDEAYSVVPGYKVDVADTVGAGDAFAAAFIHGLDHHWDAQRCGAFANAVAALVASRSGAIPQWEVEEVWPMLPAKSSFR